MSKNAVIIFKLSKDWVTRRHQVRLYTDWLTEHNVDITITIRDHFGEPIACIMEPEDAVAFKLRFGL